MKYVVYWKEYLRDGQEEGGRIVPSLEAALEMVQKMVNGFCGDNCDFRLFELGREIPLATEMIEEPQPARKSVRFSVEGGK